MGGAAAGRASSSAGAGAGSPRRSARACARCVRESRGRVGNLSAKERMELRKLVGKLDLKGMGRELLALRAVRKRGLRRR